jgi:hypothetical protein
MKKGLSAYRSLFFILFAEISKMMNSNFFRPAACFLVYAFFLSLFTACNGNGESTEKLNQQPVEKIQKFGSGKISRRYFEVNGMKEGKMTDYYPEGQLKAEKFFKDNKQEGRTLIYYPSGKTKEVQYYEKGLKQGGDTVWYEDGKVEFTVQFNQDKKDGYLRKWLPDGKLTYEAKFENEVLVEVQGKSVHNSEVVPVTGDTLRKGQ